MSSFIYKGNTPEQDRFVTISDFKDCMNRNGEVNFIWKGIEYFVGPTPSDFTGKPYVIGTAGNHHDESTEKLCDNADEILEYHVSGDRLRAVITQVEVMFRSI